MIYEMINTKFRQQQKGVYLRKVVWAQMFMILLFLHGKRKKISFVDFTEKFLGQWRESLYLMNNTTEYNSLYTILFSSRNFLYYLASSLHLLKKNPFIFENFQACINVDRLVY